MQWKKVMSGVLTGALILTSVTPAAASVEDIPVIEAQETAEDIFDSETEIIAVEEAERQEQTAVLEDEDTAVSEESVGAVFEEGLVASYDFEGDAPLQNKVNIAESSSTVVKGLENYDGTVNYGDGRKSGGKAIQLSEDYGLKLNKKNLGKNFTVSAWVKPSKQLDDNQNVIFLGYHAPQQWVGVSGKTGESWKIWAHGNGYDWSTLFNPTVETNQWSCLTITGTENSLTAYVNGEKLGSKITNDPLSGENQDIYLGVTYWDTPFAGLIDDVKVYNRTLTDTEAYQLYDDTKTAKDILAEKGITATESMSLVKDHTKKIQVNMNPVIEEANPTITYTTSNESVAIVDENGTVTGVDVGNVVITTSVTIGNTIKTAKTTVEVVDSQEGNLVASYTFNGNLDNEKNANDAASAIITGLVSYSGSVQYADDGHTDKAVKLGDYGLKLNKQNLGTDYTVSVWLKPDGTLTSNQSVMLMGYHEPERWLGVAGENGTNTCKIWAKGEKDGVSYAHSTLFLPVISSDRWHNLTFTGTKGKVTVYLDGISLGTKDSIDSLSGENQEIYLGVNYWDPEFTGLMDDVKIYSDALTEEEVQKQYQSDYNAILEDKLQKAVTVESILGRNTDASDIKYDLELPSELDGIAINWSSTDTCIAADGTVKNADSN